MAKSIGDTLFVHCMDALHTDKIGHVISDTRPFCFSRAMLKSWEGLEMRLVYYNASRGASEASPQFCYLPSHGFGIKAGADVASMKSVLKERG